MFIVPLLNTEVEKSLLAHRGKKSKNTTHSTWTAKGLFVKHLSGAVHFAFLLAAFSNLPLTDT